MEHFYKLPCAKLRCTDPPGVSQLRHRRLAAAQAAPELSSPRSHFDANSRPD
jgi:hypothetical protein